MQRRRATFAVVISKFMP
uniref:Uncharacterized protein n=1 Tax=Rhizophora mucronata TaxID=61149 RepID=A0A2P2N5B6_RHIMU